MDSLVQFVSSQVLPFPGFSYPLASRRPPAPFQPPSPASSVHAPFCIHTPCNHLLFNHLRTLCFIGGPLDVKQIVSFQSLPHTCQNNGGCRISNGLEKIPVLEPPGRRGCSSQLPRTEPWGASATCRTISTPRHPLPTSPKSPVTAPFNTQRSLAAGRRLLFPVLHSSPGGKFQGLCLHALN
jgi:hypothetical protein